MARRQRKICPGCDTVFIPKRASAKVCSSRCRKRLERARKSQAGEPRDLAHSISTLAKNAEEIIKKFEAELEPSFATEGGFIGDEQPQGTSQSTSPTITVPQVITPASVLNSVPPQVGQEAPSPQPKPIPMEEPAPASTNYLPDSNLLSISPQPTEQYVVKQSRLDIFRKYAPLAALPIALAVIIPIVLAIYGHSTANNSNQKSPSQPSSSNQNQPSSSTQAFQAQISSISLNKPTIVTGGNSFTATGPVIIQNELDTINAFRIQNAAGANLFVADTRDQKIAIGGGALDPTGAALQVAGNINATGTISSNGTLLTSGGLSANSGATNLSNAGLVINSVLICTSAGCSADTLGGHPASFYTNASNLLGGTLPNSVLPANVALIDANQTFSGTNTFNGQSNFNGITIQNGNFLFKSALNSVGAFQIQNAAGNDNLLVADTVNTRLGVGTGTPNYTLDVNGDVNVSTGHTFRIDGVDVCSGGLCHPAGGSGFYIQNTTGTQISANFNIQSGSYTSVGGIIQGASGQTADLFEGKNSAGTTVFALDPFGNVNITGNYEINGANLCTAGGCTAASGSGSYIQNGIALQATANFNIESANTAYVVGVLRGITGQTADILQLKDGNGNVVNSVGANGAVLAKDTSVGGNHSFFQIQGSNFVNNLLTADTVTGQILLPNANLSSTALLFAGNANLYAPSNNTLKTDNNLLVAGSLGVGVTSTPSRKLHVKADGAGSGDGIFLQVGSDADGLLIQNQYGSQFQVARLQQSGGFGVLDLYDNVGVLGVAISGMSGTGIKFGSAGDTNLYRSAANLLKTDDSFQVATNLGVGYDPTTITGGVAAFNGNVGIGITNPQYALEVSRGDLIGYVTHIQNSRANNGSGLLVSVASASSALHLERDAGANGFLDINFNSQKSTFNSFGDYVLQANGTERLRVTTAGNVGIGTTPSSPLDISIGATSNYSTIHLTTTAASSGSVGIVFQNSNTNRFGALRLAGGSSDLLQLGGDNSLNSNLSAVQIGTQVMNNVNPFLQVGTTNTYLLNSNFGIGLTNPQGALSLGSDAGTAASGIKFGSAGDTALYRSTPNQLDLNNGSGTYGTIRLQNIQSFGAGSGQPVLQAFILSSDSNPAVKIDGIGKLQWGSGGASALDTNLYRSAAGVLNTDGQYAVGRELDVGTPTPSNIQGRIQYSGDLIATGSPPSGKYISLSGNSASSSDTWGVFSVYTQSVSNTSIRGFEDSPTLSGVITVANRYGVKVDGVVKTGGAALTNNYAIRVEDQTGSGTNNYGLYFAAGGLQNAISFAGDTNLYRAAAGQLKTDGQFYAGSDIVTQGANSAFLARGAATATTIRLAANVTGDTFDRLQVQADGKLLWGPGSGATDTNLYRSAAGVLNTDGQLQAAGNITAGMAPGGANFVQNAAVGFQSAFIIERNSSYIGGITTDGTNQIGLAVGGVSWSNAVLKLNSTGAVTFQNTSNSTTGFQVNSSGSTQVLGVDTANLGVNVTNLQSSGTISLQGPDGGSILLRTAANSGTGTNAMTFSGNEITDASRSQDTQGDGRQPPDSSTGIWEGTTNLVTNGGFESNTTGWHTGAGVTATQDGSKSKFGSYSYKVVTTGVNQYIEGGGTLSVGARSNLISTTAGTAYTISAWVFVPNGQSMLIAPEFYDSAGTFLSGPPVTNFTGNGTWQRVIAANQTAPATTAYMNVTIQSSTATTFWVDGIQAEQKAIATPYVETSGSTQARSGGRIQAPSAILNATQGWVAARVRPSWNSSAGAGQPGNPAIFDLTDNANNILEADYQAGSAQWRLFSQNGTGNDSALSSAQPFSAGDTVTIIFAWDATHLKFSTNGTAFASSARAHVQSAATSLDFGSGGTRVANSFFDGDINWLASGTGTLTDADASTIYKLGNSDPTISGLNSLSSITSPTFVWDGESTQYSGTNNTPILQSGISIDDVNLYRSASNTLTASSSFNIQNTSTTAFQIQSSNGATTIFTADTSGSVITLGTAGSTPVILVLGSKTTAGDPATCTAGAVYYNSSSSGLRSCQSTPNTWQDVGNPVGTILAYGASTAPDGYLAADGSAVSRTTYARLFAIIGTTYGAGDGSTTFNLPDLRGRVAVGLNTSEVGRTDVNALGKNEGQAVGNRTPYHNTSNNLGISWSLNSVSYSNYQGSSAGHATDFSAASGAFYDPITGSINLTGSIGINSANAPTDTPAYLTVNYIIKY